MWLLHLLSPPRLLREGSADGAAPDARDGEATRGPTWGTLLMCCRSLRSVVGTAPSPGSICPFTLWLATRAQVTLILPGASRR